jgi:hypothetical protein
MALNVGPVQAEIRRIAERMEKGAQRGLNRCGQELLARASAECPIEEGTLVRTGQVVTRDGSVGVGFGHGGAEEYAVYVEEDLTKHHPHGNAKFLGNNHPAMNSEGTYLRIIGQSVEQAMG